MAVIIKTRVGDLRPVILPAKSVMTSQKASILIGDQPSIPLQISDSFKIGVFAKDLGAPRDLQLSPGGTMLASIPSKGEIVALPDKNNDGRSDETKIIISNLKNPHGIAFFNNKLFVAQETELDRYNFDEGSLTATLDKKLFNIPVGGRHTSRTIEFNSKGEMFVSIGSTCDVCMERNAWNGAVIVSNAEGIGPKVYSSGLRNAVFIKLNPKSDSVWGVEMGRDYLGDNLPPDEINILREGGNFGWPYCYGDKTHDDSFDPRNSHGCSDTIAPVFKIQAHSAPLGLNFINSAQFPADWQGDLLVSFHGSWNRSVPTGFKVVHMKVSGENILSQEDFLTGFLQGSNTLGRPVDLEFDKEGSLFISDDKAGAVYKVIKK